MVTRYGSGASSSGILCAPSRASSMAITQSIPSSSPGEERIKRTIITRATSGNTVTTLRPGQVTVTDA